MLASSGSTLSGSTFSTRSRIETAGRALPAVRFAATALLAIGALAFAAVGWAAMVLPSLRTLAPDQLPNALRLSSAGPLLLGVGAAHAIAAVLSVSPSVSLRRWSAALLFGGALATAALAGAGLVGAPVPAGLVTPLVPLTVAYLCIAALQLAATRVEH